MNRDPVIPDIAAGMPKPPPRRGGEYVYRAPLQHECCLPPGANIGDIWRCDCGQHWERRRGRRRWYQVLYGVEQVRR